MEIYSPVLLDNIMINGKLQITLFNNSGKLL